MYDNTQVVARRIFQLHAEADAERLIQSTKVRLEPPRGSLLGRLFRRRQPSQASA